MFLPNNAGVDALSIERSYEGGWMIFFRFGNVIVRVGAGSAKLKYRFKQSWWSECRRFLMMLAMYGAKSVNTWAIKNLNDTFFYK